MLTFKSAPAQKAPSTKLLMMSTLVSLLLLFCYRGVVRTIEPRERGKEFVYTLK